MKVVVIGGGFIGQLVQLLIPSALVLDWRKVAPTNHMETRIGPQYLWEPIIHDGVGSESFSVQTRIDGELPTESSILAYKRKIGKENDGGDWATQFRPETIGWASALPVPRIDYGRTVHMVDLNGHVLGMENFTTITYDVLVNTIPMPSFLDMLITGPDRKTGFTSNPIFMRRELGGEEYPNGSMMLNYISRSDRLDYRETRVGTTKYFETITHPHGRERHTRIVPGKIHPNPESERILRELGKDQCWSFGRFATWRPDELAHESWKLIQKWKTEYGL